MKAMEELARRLGGMPFRLDVPMASYSTFRVGGAAPILAEPEDEGQALRFIQEAEALEMRWECLGSGANLLISDAPLPFPVLKCSAPSFHGVRILGEEGRILAGAGASLEGLVRKAAEAGLAGLEGLAGIPASVGGALAMNAGGKHGEISQALTSIRVACGAGLREIPKAACGFGYRHSGLKGMAVLSAEFRLAPGRVEDLRERMRAVKEEKRRTQPLQDSSAGCVFRNPKGGSSGRLIEAAGLKGLREGRAQVSSVHANFIVNLGGATADELTRLIARVQEGVRRAHGVELELEVRRWP